MIDQQTRQLALRGEYIPKGSYYAISKDGTLLPEVYAYYTRDYYQFKISEGFKFFPDEQTRTEYLQVGEGTWLPKDGDLFCACNKNDLSHSWHEDFTLWTYYSNDWTNLDSIHYFPSVPQMLSFIAKRKGEEPKPEEIPFTPWNYNPVVPTTPKPQTITICVSDEAIDEAIGILHGASEKEDMETYRNNARQFIALLHLEATLNS